MRICVLQDPHGGNLDKWRMCSAEDEPLILQQFLRFTVTITITIAITITSSSSGSPSPGLSPSSSSYKSSVRRMQTQRRSCRTK